MRLVWLGGVLLAAATAFSLPLVRTLPRAPVRIGPGGESWLCPPAADTDGNLFVLWRGITGFRNGLVESLFFQRVAAGSPVSATPAVVWQGSFDLVDNSANPAAGAAAVVPDDAGGAYYLCGPWVLRIDGQGKNLWPGQSQPSRVRVNSDRQENIGALRIFPDGRGGVLAVWRSSRGVRAQRIAPAGTLSWGADGINLYGKKDEAERTYGRAVPDGKGGLVAFLMSNTYEENRKPRVVFFDGAGRLVRQSAPLELGITLENDSAYEIESDGQGGLYILYSRYTRTGPPLQGHAYRRFREVRLVRVDSSGRTVFAAGLSGGRDLVPDRLLLRGGSGNGVLASWQHTVLADDPDDGDDMLHIEIGLRRADGGSPWRGNAVLRLKAETGPDKWKTETGLRDMLQHGDRVYFVRDAMAPGAGGRHANNVFLHRIDGSGKVLDAGEGRRISGEYGGYWPYLLLHGTRPVLVYHSSRAIGGVRDFVVPVLERLTP